MRFRNGSHAGCCRFAHGRQPLLQVPERARRGRIDAIATQMRFRGGSLRAVTRGTRRDRLRAGVARGRLHVLVGRIYRLRLIVGCCIGGLRGGVRSAIFVAGRTTVVWRAIVHVLCFAGNTKRVCSAGQNGGFVLNIDANGADRSGMIRGHVQGLLNLSLNRRGA